MLPLAAALATSLLDLEGVAIVGETNPNYASWTIDSSYNRGFVHTDFSNENLLAGATSLAPSTIRFGGGGNDYLHYDPAAPCNSTADNDNSVCLNASHWNDLYTMANKSGTAFLFGVSFDMAEACIDKGKYTWDPTQTIGTHFIIDVPLISEISWGFDHKMMKMDSDDQVHPAAG